MNGFSARTDVFLDGFRDRGQYYRDTFPLDSVEVLMGPSSMLFGRGSTGGAIKQVTKKPQLRELTDIGASVTSNGLVCGPQYLSARFDQPADLVRVGGYTRWDATAACKQKKYDIRVNLFNLTNKAYYDALIQSDGGRSVPGSGRTVMLSFNYRL